ncbi:hypothetical protein VNO78_22376 [Psophocarpus tetragonolobus]|uniref:IMS import disulfide relay-system CHCH-CHCH-like Cx9C domain-containing protein n=1 Tax=Psophocarpus tetragonolobus TaxID=3891 RepID=A0AAN9SDC2_PSOTE
MQPPTPSTSCRSASDAVDQPPPILPVARQPSERAFPGRAASDAVDQPPRNVRRRQPATGTTSDAPTSHRATFSLAFSRVLRRFLRRRFCYSRSRVFFQIMGRKAGNLFINSKRFGSLHKPCMKEMALFLNCMAANNSDVEACARQKDLLNACMESQSKKNRKSWGSINYQLQRLSRGRN